MTYTSGGIDVCKFVYETSLQEVGKNILYMFCCCYCCCCRDCCDVTGFLGEFSRRDSELELLLLLRFIACSSLSFLIPCRHLVRCCRRRLQR
jgi:hypothetical protein